MARRFRSWDLQAVHVFVILSMFAALVAITVGFLSSTSEGVNEAISQPEWLYLGAFLVLSAIFIHLSWHELVDLVSKSMSFKTRTPPDETQQALDSKVDHLLFELRWKRLENLGDLCLYLTMTGLGACFLYWLSSGQSSSNFNHNLVSFILVQYALLISLKAFGHHASQANSWLNLAQTVLILRVLMMPQQGTWFLNSSIRTLTRLLLGVVQLDFKASVAWAIANLIANTYKGFQMSKGLSNDNFGTQLTLFEVAYAEFGSALVLVVSTYLFEHWERQRLHALVQAEESRNEKSSIRKLLSVFCDAIVHLGPELHLKGPHQKLCHILGAESETRSTTSRGYALDGEDFTKFLADSEMSRFLTFIKAASPSDIQSERIIPPPSSLPLQMRDAKGCLFQANIFHVYYPSVNGDAGHILGICESRTHKTLERPRGSHITAGGQVPLGPKELTRKKAGSSSSRSSSCSGRGSRGFVRSLFKALEGFDKIHVVCDPLSEGLTVRQLTILFAEAGEREPQLEDWFPPEDWSRLLSFTRDATNEMVSGKTELCNFSQKPVSLQFGVSDDSGMVRIESMFARMQPKVGDDTADESSSNGRGVDSESDDDDDSQEDMAYISLTMQQLQVLRTSTSMAPAPSSLPTIEESQF